MNYYQQQFLEYLAIIQEQSVAIALCKYKNGDDIENLLYNVTSDVIIEMMVMIDGYSSFSNDKMDIVNQKTGERVKDNPFIELHDCVCEYLKFEKFPEKLNNANVLEYTSVGNYGKVDEYIWEVRYMAICQYDGEDKYHLFYCSSSEGKYKVLRDDLLESVEQCKEVAEKRGKVWWNRNMK